MWIDTREHNQTQSFQGYMRKLKEEMLLDINSAKPEMSCKIKIYFLMSFISKKISFLQVLWLYLSLSSKFFLKALHNNFSSYPYLSQTFFCLFLFWPFFKIKVIKFFRLKN